MILKFFSSCELHEEAHCVKSWTSNRSRFEVVWRTKNSGKSNKRATLQMMPIQIIARPGWGLYRSGKQIAYHRSIDMNVSVKIETVTLTVCKDIKERQRQERSVETQSEKEKLD